LKHREDHIGEELEGAPLSPFKGVLLLLSGTVALKYGAELFVSGISSTALALGLSERFVALTMVAFGTSVPELAASFIAARKGEADIAIGNIIGSNIFNILSVLGFAALVQPIELIDRNLLHVDFAVSFFLSLLIIPLMGLFKADRLDRLEGALLLGIYIVYIVALVFQG
jgi:cation:H+ antiporter